MIADRIVIENNEIIFRLDIETAGANAAEIAVRARDEAVDARDEAEGIKNNLTPSIGVNGNWHIGTTDTGVKAEGEDGREVEFQKSATHIQWRYVGDTTWTNLVALEDITGPDGDPADTSSKLDKSIQFGPDISGSTSLSEEDNATLREITATGTITVPSGLTIGWNAELVSIASGDVTITAAGTLRNGAANKLKPGKGCVIYHKGGNIIQAIGLEE